MKSKIISSLVLTACLGLVALAAKQDTPKPQIPDHECCHNGKCCGTIGCCDKTGCKSAKCPSIKK